MEQGIALSVTNTAEQASEARLIALVLDTVTSEHSRRSYRTGLVRLLGWIRVSESAPTFTKALVGGYRAHLLDAGLSPPLERIQAGHGDPESERQDATLDLYCQYRDTSSRRLRFVT